MKEEPIDSSNEPGLMLKSTSQDSNHPGAKKMLRDTLEKLPGLESVSISPGKVTAHYEPVLLSKNNWKKQSKMPDSGFPKSTRRLHRRSPTLLPKMGNRWRSSSPNSHFGKMLNAVVHQRESSAGQKLTVENHFIFA
jgi:hypothetical protein